LQRVQSKSLSEKAHDDFAEKKGLGSFSAKKQMFHALTYLFLIGYEVTDMFVAS